MTVSLAETMKKMLTKLLTVCAHPQDISQELVDFVEKNLRKNPGKSTLRFTLEEPRSRTKVSLVSMSQGFEMNEELIRFLELSPQLDVQVLTV